MKTEKCCGNCKNWNRENQSETKECLWEMKAAREWGAETQKEAFNLYPFNDEIYCPVFAPND